MSPFSLYYLWLETNRTLTLDNIQPATKQIHGADNLIID